MTKINFIKFVMYHKVVVNRKTLDLGKTDFHIIDILYYGSRRVNGKHNLSMVTVEDIVKNEIDIVLENGLVSNEEQWILLKDKLGTDYAYFVPLLDKEGIIAGY